MEFTERTGHVATKARKMIQAKTTTISQGEAAAISAWYSFICDHAQCEGVDPKQLARHQLNAFLAAMPVNVERDQYKDEWSELDAAARANLGDSGFEEFQRYKKQLRSEGHIWLGDARDILAGYIWDESEGITRGDEEE